LYKFNLIINIQKYKLKSQSSGVILSKEKKKIGFIMCVCTGKCPGFAKMDIWDFINRVRVELPVEYGFIHPQLCEEDGDRFLEDFLQNGRKYMIGGCAPNMQYKLFRDSFKKAGLDVKKDLIPLDIREMTTDQAVKLVENTIETLEKEDNDDE
jgi:heterodisulfide reductase subunit A-like polyferredoxin